MKLLRINLSEKNYNLQDLPEDLQIIGGRGLTAKILSTEVPPTCDPLGKDNKLIFSCGPLAASGASSSGRLSVGGKSPLTGGIKEANAGGMAAIAIAKLGLRAVILEGKVEDSESYILKLDESNCNFLDGTQYKGLGNYELAKKLFEKYGKDYAIISIGQGGEQKLFTAGISITDFYERPSRLAARGGLGAVMGSKGVKAILINKKGSYRYPNIKNSGFIAARKRFNDIVSNSERISVLKKYGTASTVMLVQKLGALPTNNFSKGNFDKAENISGEAMYDIIKERGGEGKNTETCMAGCLIKCSNVYPNRNGKELVAPLEYESICLLGSNLGIGDLDAIARLNYLCNDYGLDTIDVGAALGVMAEAGLIDFGDFEGFEKVLQGIPRGEVNARLVGMGAYICAQVLGVERVPAAKKQAFSAYDPRGVKGTGVTYLTSPMGADHTAGLTVFAPVDHHSHEGQIELSKKMQIGRAAYDALGLCAFLMGATAAHPQAVIEMLNNLYGVNLPSDYLEKLGKEVLRLEIQFNKEAGLPICEQLPEYLSREKLPPYDLDWTYDKRQLEEIFEEI